MPMTDAELKDFLNHHVTYELVQLEDAFMLARTEPVSGGRMNAYIKSWAVHARALHYFFNVDPNNRKYETDIFARHYTIDGEYASAYKIDDDTLDKINQQIVHITSQRHTTRDRKLNNMHMDRITPELLGEAENFRGFLRGEFKPWNWQRCIVFRPVILPPS